MTVGGGDCTCVSRTLGHAHQAKGAARGRAGPRSGAEQWPAAWVVALGMGSRRWTRGGGPLPTADPPYGRPIEGHHLFRLMCMACRELLAAIAFRSVNVTSVSGGRRRAEP